jgi:hypothetical protein
LAADFAEDSEFNPEKFTTKIRSKLAEPLLVDYFQNFHKKSIKIAENRSARVRHNSQVYPGIFFQLLLTNEADSTEVEIFTYMARNQGTPKSIFLTLC